jgi:hypothetical protein
VSFLVGHFELLAERKVKGIQPRPDHRVARRVSIMEDAPRPRSVRSGGRVMVEVKRVVVKESIGVSPDG